MRFLEALNRMLVGMLLSLVLLQAGLLFFMKNMEDQAQFRLVQNTTKTDLTCGENLFSESMYWNLLDMNTTSYSSCEESDCAFSHMSWKRDEQDKELHVISVQAAPAFRWGEMDQGGSVRVNIKKGAKPQVISLISQERLEWAFKVEKGAIIEKVVVATPNTVWLKDLPVGVQIEYLPKEKMCSYPFTWEEAFNQDNEFRILSSSLEKITGLKIDSFQGARVGKEFRIPMFEQSRRLASVESSKEDVAPIAPDRDIVWDRQDGYVVARKVVMSDKTEVSLPEKTQQVLKTKDQIFIVKDFLLWRWSPQNAKFEPLREPLSMPQVREVRSIAWDSGTQNLYVYNDDRGGELYKVTAENDQWTLLSSGYNYNIQSLFFDEQEKSLVAVASRGIYFTKLLKMDLQGKIQNALDLKSKVSFDQKRWKWLLAKKDSAYWVEFHQSLYPQGHSVPLDVL